MDISISQNLRPIRLAFLIQPNNEGSFSRAIKLASSLWGGVYFPILQINRGFTKKFREEYLVHESPVEFYSNTIENFDPDYIVIEKELNIEFVNSIKGDRQAITFEEIEDSIYNKQAKYGLTIDNILLHLKDFEFKYQRNDGLKILLPRPKTTTDLYAAVLTGCLDQKFYEILNSYNSIKSYTFFETASNQTVDLFEKSNIINCLGVGKYFIKTNGHPFWSAQSAIYLIDNTRLNDLMNFWNLRALGWNVLPIPIQDYKKQHIKKRYAFFQNEYFSTLKHIELTTVLTGYTIDDKSENKILNHLKIIRGVNLHGFVHQGWMPRFWVERKYLNYDRTANVNLSSHFQNQILSIENKIQVEVLTPKFEISYVSHTEPRFVNEMGYVFEDLEGKYAQVLPPKISSQNLAEIIDVYDYGVLNKNPTWANKWRFSNSGMHSLLNGASKKITFQIPKAIEVFELWFKTEQKAIKISSSGKLTYRLLKNMGGIYGINFFANHGIPPILQMFENGKVVSCKKLFDQITRQSNHFVIKEPKQIVNTLLKKHIIQFGTEIQCPFCNQRSFYTLEDLNEVVKCPICIENFKIPIYSPNEIVWAYRGIGAFAKNNSADGVLAVLLTLRFFKITLSVAGYSKPPTSILSFDIEIEKGKPNEVDLAFFNSSGGNTDVIFCECKTVNNFKDEDITKMRRLALMHPGSILLFATLKEELTKEEKELIVPLVKEFRKGNNLRPLNPVLILTKNELLNTYTHDALKRIKSDLGFETDEIGQLCDNSVKEYLGLTTYASIIERRIEKRRVAYVKKKGD